MRQYLAVKLMQLVRNSLTPGVYMICTATYGSGAKTDMIRIIIKPVVTAQTQKILVLVRTAFYVAVLGAATRGVVVLRIGATTILPVRPSTLVSVPPLSPLLERPSEA